MLEVAAVMMSDPIKILVKQEELTLDGIKQFYINVCEEKFKFDTLFDLYCVMDLTQVVIFVNTIKKAEWLFTELVNKEFQVSCIVSSLCE